MSLELKHKTMAVAAFCTVTAISTWTSWQHDGAVHADFRQAMNEDRSSRVLTVETDGVTRKGYVNEGASMPNFNIGFYNRPSKALLISQSPEAKCWSTTLRVTDGRENLPLWQKIMGGAEYVRVFDNARFEGWLTRNCAPIKEVNSLSLNAVSYTHLTLPTKA